MKETGRSGHYIETVAGSEKVSQPAITKALDTMNKPGIVRETTGRQCGRIFVYDQYLKFLNEGTKPLRR